MRTLLYEFPKGMHDNPPAPFNPDYDPKDYARYTKVTQSMETDGWYTSHTREECKAEWARRYEELKRKEQPCPTK